MGAAARHDADEHADSPGTAPRKRRLKPLVIGIAIVVVVALVATAAVLIVAKGFTEQEKQVRSDWTVETGDMLKRIDGLGRVVRTYPLGGYELHHDINYGPDNTVVALAEAPGRTTVEDLVIEVDLETGAVTELVDFSELMADYKEPTRTRSVPPTPSSGKRENGIGSTSIRWSTCPARTPSSCRRAKRRPSSR